MNERKQKPNQTAKRRPPTRKPRRTAAAKAPERNPRKAKPDKAPPAQTQPLPEQGAGGLEEFLANAWYEAGTKFPWVYRESAGATGEYFSFATPEFTRRLRLFGVRTRAPEGELVSEGDKIIARLQSTRVIHRSLRLAGYKEGVRSMNGQRILVRGGPDLPEPVQGEMPELWAFLNQLSGKAWQPGAKDDAWHEHQLQTFLFWLARRWTAIKEENPALFSQALFLIGDPGSGKTFLQEWIIRRALGGRAHNAHDYISGEDRFTGALFGSEFIYVSDPPGASSDRKGRMAQQTRIKELVTGTEKNRRGMYQDGETLSPIWSVSYSANVEKIDSLPPFDDDFSGKCHLLRCFQTDIPKGKAASAEWAAKIREQIPALLHLALETFGDERNLLPALREEHGRFGQRAFHHPDLLQSLGEFSREQELLQIIDAVLLPRGDELPGAVPPAWKGSASALRMELRERSSGRRALEKEVDGLLRGGDKATGRLLAAAAKRFPERVQKADRKAAERGWVILPAAIAEPEREAE